MLYSRVCINRVKAIFKIHGYVHTTAIQAAKICTHARLPLRVIITSQTIRHRQQKLFLHTNDALHPSSLYVMPLNASAQFMTLKVENGKLNKEAFETIVSLKAISVPKRDCHKFMKLLKR